MQKIYNCIKGGLNMHMLKNQAIMGWVKKSSLHNTPKKIPYLT